MYYYLPMHPWNSDYRYWKAWLVFYNAKVHITNDRVLSLGTQPFLSAKVLISKSTDTETVELRIRILISGSKRHRIFGLSEPFPPSLQNKPAQPKALAAFRIQIIVKVVLVFVLPLLAVDVTASYCYFSPAREFCKSDYD